VRWLERRKHPGSILQHGKNAENTEDDEESPQRHGDTEILEPRSHRGAEKGSARADINASHVGQHAGRHARQQEQQERKRRCTSICVPAVLGDALPPKAACDAFGSVSRCLGGLSFGQVRGREAT